MASFYKFCDRTYFKIPNQCEIGLIDPTLSDDDIYDRTGSVRDIRY
jgi:hypothetical protein